MKKGSNILIPTSKGMVLEKTKNVVCICAEGSYCELMLVGGNKFMITKNLAYICELLPSDTFFRIHASVVINLEHIRKIIGNEVFLDNDLSFLVAQRRKREFLIKLKEKSLFL